MIGTVFDAETGRALHLLEGSPKSVALNVEDGEVLVEGRWLGTHFLNVETGKPNRLKVMKPAASANRLTRLPPGTQISGADFDAVVTATGEEDFATPHEQALRVELSHPHYRDAEVTVPCEAGAAKGIAVRQDVRGLRRAEYERRGLSIEALIVARAEADSGDAEEYDRILSERREVKRKYPKPKEK